jgi:hypothetical protein
MKKTRVEIPDKRFQPIPGYRLQDSIGVDRNDVAAPIFWTEREDVSELAGQPVRHFPWLTSIIMRLESVAQARRVSPRPPTSASAPPAGAQGMHPDGCDTDGEFARERRRSWARLIKKAYEADPLVCPRCSGPLKIISLIGDGPVIE